MTRGPGRSGVLVATLLALAAVGWVGDAHTTAAAPAELISVDPKSGPLPYDSSQPSVSGDGNIVVINTSSFNASLGIVEYRIFIRNRSANTTTTIPGLPTEFATYPGTAAGVISRDGCHVGFWGRDYYDYAAGQWNIYTWNRCVAGSIPIDVVDNVLAPSQFPGQLASSADGRYLAYMIPNPSAPVFGWVDTTTLAKSTLPTGFVYSTGIDISDDGKYVAVSGQLASQPNYQVIGWQPPCIVGLAVVCKTDLISVRADGQSASGYNTQPSISADGRYVAFTSSSPELPSPAANGGSQVYIRDRVAGVTKIVSDTPGQSMNTTGWVDSPDISPDGTQIALVISDQFENGAVYVARSASGFFDTSAIDLISYGVDGKPVTYAGGAGSPSMSSNGRYVAFASSADASLSGGTIPDGTSHTWMRARPIALDITAAVDFGAVTVGTQSPPKNVVVTNTSGVQINIAAVVPPSSPFFVTANTCGGVLQPGTTCAVTLVFRPTAPGSSSSSVTVTGDGLSVASALVGTGRGLGALSIKPTSASYGTAVVGTVIAPQTFTVTNTGQAAVSITGVTLNGSGADQFTINTNGCTGSLAPGASCTIAVGATVTRNGSFSATLRVTGAAGEVGQATLRLGGDFLPTLKMNPGVVSPGEVTAAIGEGFPPNIDVQLGFEGEAEPLATVHTDAAGAFRYDLLILRNGIRIGGRQVIAYDQPTFSGVKAPLLIDLATYRPSGFESATFASTVRSMYTRGG